MAGHRSVGGDQLLEQVAAELRRAALEGGRALFVIGPPGAGKSGLLRAARRAARWRQLRLRTALVDCSALPPGSSAWAQLGGAATAHLRAGHVARSTAGDWVNLLPVVGDVLSAVVGTVRTLRRGAGRAELPGDPGSAAAAGVRLLLRQGADHARLLVLDSLEAASGADLAATARFVRELPGTRTLLLVGARGRLGRAAGPVEDVVLEGERLGLARRLDLGGAATTATTATATTTTTTAIAATTTTTPAAPPLLPSGLAPADLTLLARAATLGPTFSATALAEMAGLEELEVEDRLARLARTGVVRFRESGGAGDSATSVYAFADPALARSLAALAESA